MTPFVIAVLGVQASGKGTQAELLAERLHIPTLSPGALFRRISEEDTEAGRTVRGYINRGELLPLSISDPILFTELADPRYAAGVILDGYPRSLEQATYLDTIAPVRYAVHIRISDEEATRRIASRRSCSCGAVYNLISNPPRQPEICDRCGKALTIRDDDRPEAIRRRLEIFHSETEQVLAQYRVQGKLIELDGAQSIDTVFNDLLKMIEKKVAEAHIK